MLANSTRGLSLLNLCLIYITVVLPVLTFGAAVWYTGIRQKAHTKRLQLAQNSTLQHISGCFQTTPLDPIHHITSILPIDIYLDRLLDNAAIRLRSLPSTSQPMLRLGPEWKPYAGHLPILYQCAESGCSPNFFLSLTDLMPRGLPASKVDARHVTCHSHVSHKLCHGHSVTSRCHCHL